MQVMSNGKIRRTEVEWRQILSRWKKGGLDPEEFCRREDLRLSSFKRWQERLGDLSPQTPFVSVTPQPPSENTTDRWTLELTLPNGVHLRFQG